MRNYIFIFILSLLFFCSQGLAETGKILWKTGNVPEYTWSTPIVIDQKIFLQDQDGGIYSFRKSDGEQLWYQKLAEAWPSSSPVYRHDKIYVLAGPTIYRLNPKCGDIEKEFTDPQGDSAASMAPAVSETHVYFSTYNNLYALDRETFEIAWQKPIKSANIIVYNNTIYAFSDKLYALNPETGGSEIWSLDPPDSNGFGMGAIADDIIIAFTKQNDQWQSQIHSFQLSQDNQTIPTKLWSADMGNNYNSWTPPSIDAVNGNVYATSCAGILKAFDLDGNGSVLWQKIVRSQGTSAALAITVDGNVYVQVLLDAEGENPEEKALLCLKGMDGSEIWRTLDDPEYTWQISWGSPVIDQSVVYLASDHGGGLIAIDGGEIDGSWYMVKQNPDLTGKTGDWNKEVINMPSTLGLAAENGNTSFAFSDKPPAKIGLPDYQINTSTLNLVLEGTLFWMKTRGPSIAMGLTYNADHTLPMGMFGNGWRLGYETFIDIGCDGKSVELRKGTGQLLTFESDVDLTEAGLEFPINLNPPEGNFDRLTMNDGSFEWWEKSSQMTYTYVRTTKAGSNLSYLKEIQDRNNNKVTIDIDTDTGEINTISGPAGRAIGFEYNLDGYCSKISTPAFDSRHIDFEYDAKGNLTKIIDMAGYTANYEYDEDNYLNKIITGSYNTAFEYESRGENKGKYVTRVIDSETGWVGYEILEKDPIEVKRTSRVGRSKIFQSRNGKTGIIKDAMGYTSQITYKNSLPIRFTDRKGNISRQTYDSNGNIITKTDEEGKTTYYTYDNNGNLTSRKTPLLQTWNYYYDSKGNQTSIRNPDGSTILKSYNPYGQLSKLTDPNENQTSYAYDFYGNVTKITDSLINDTTYTYDAAHLRCTSIIDARENGKHLRYDDNDRLTYVYFGAITENRYIQNTFDAVGQVKLNDENRNETLVERNRHGYITKKVPPLKNTTLYYYDNDNNLIKTTTPMGKNIYTTYDNNSRPVKSTDQLGNDVIRSYDKEDNLTSIIDKRGNETKFEHDNINNVVKTIDPKGIETIMTRDGLGRITGITTGNSDIINYEYDFEDRKTSIKYNGAFEASFEYDPAGNLLKMIDDSGATTYSHNKLNKVSSILYPDNKTIIFTYDKIGNIETITYPDGMVVSYEYDNLNRVVVPRGLRNGVNVELNPSKKKTNKVTAISFLNKTLTFEYDMTAMPVKTTRPNQTDTQLSYDMNIRLTTMAHTLSGSDSFDISFGHNSNDMVSSETSSHKLIPAMDDLTFTGLFNTSNQIESWNNKTYTYDNNGNLIQGENSIFNAAYDPENKLLEITRAGVSSQFVYNGLGQRVRRIVGTETKNFYYDRSDRLLFESDGQNNILNMYIYAGKRVIAMVNNNNVYYYHYGKTGNVLALSNEDGNIITRYAYTPFGEKTVSGPAIENPFTFVGGFGVEDNGEGIFCMKKRFYDADIKRFLQRDPLGFEGGTNLYAYADSNPLNYVDPEGTLPWGFFAKTATNSAIKEDTETQKKASSRRIVGNLIGGIVTGAVTGAAAGSVVPGAGTIAGAFIGATMGAAGGITTGVAMEVTGVGEKIEEFAGAAMDKASSFWSGPKDEPVFF